MVGLKELAKACEANSGSQYTMSNLYDALQLLAVAFDSAFLVYGRLDAQPIGFDSLR